jgi:hypothetical protein
MSGIRRPKDEGSITLFVVVLTLALLAAVGLVVDGGGKIRALERADESALEAARAGSQMLDVPAAVRGERVAVDPALAVRTARAYLQAAGVSGNVTVVGGAVTVSTSVIYHPVFLPIVGVGSLTVTATASARPVTNEYEEVR